MRLRLERAMTPGADARSRLNKSRPAMVTGWDHAPSRRSENCNAAVPSSFGSSQLRITLPSAMGVTRGVMLPREGGAAISRQLSVVIREPDLELQPTRPRIDGKATEKPKADEAWSNCLRVISIFFIVLPSPFKEGAKPEMRSCGAAVALNLRRPELWTTFAEGRATGCQSEALRDAQQRARDDVGIEMTSGRLASRWLERRGEKPGEQKFFSHKRGRA